VLKESLRRPRRESFEFFLFLFLIATMTQRISRREKRFIVGCAWLVMTVVIVHKYS
jgi:hypothetical protein